MLIAYAYAFKYHRIDILTKRTEHKTSFCKDVDDDCFKDVALPFCFNSLPKRYGATPVKPE